MASTFHAAILATVLVATAAVGIAGAALYANGNLAAPKADRLPVLANVDGDSWVTIETRHDGVSILKRVRLN
jgi:hypothetical protein